MNDWRAGLWFPFWRLQIHKVQLSYYWSLANDRNLCKEREGGERAGEDHTSRVGHSNPQARAEQWRCCFAVLISHSSIKTTLCFGILDSLHSFRQDHSNGVDALCRVPRKPCWLPFPWRLSLWADGSLLHPECIQELLTVLPLKASLTTKYSVFTFFKRSIFALPSELDNTRQYKFELE